LITDLQWQNIYKQTTKDLLRFASSQKDHTLSQKRKENIKMDGAIEGSMNAGS